MKTTEEQFSCHIHRSSALCRASISRQHIAAVFERGMSGVLVIELVTGGPEVVINGGANIEEFWRWWYRDDVRETS